MHELLRLSGYIDIYPQHNVTMVLHVSTFLAMAFTIIWLFGGWNKRPDMEKNNMNLIEFL